MISRDAFHWGALLVHIGVLYEFRRSNDLFLLAHRLVDAFPDRSLPWYAVGVYYLSVGRWNDARRFFSRSSVRQLDGDFAPAWIGFAHAFAALNEHDPAVNAYTTAARLLQGYVYQFISRLQCLFLVDFSLIYHCGRRIVEYVLFTRAHLLFSYVHMCRLTRFAPDM